MLSREDNEILTQVGPGTPMGDLLRRFWMPALLESEVTEPDGPPVRLRLLGEDLVAFRDSAGRLGILDAYCPHRRVHLYFGRNEEGGLRCVYHGWKFDVAGQCIDMPCEGPETDFAHKVRTGSYPTRVRGGVVWVYMGPPERMGEPPAFEWSVLPSNQSAAIKRHQSCNWAQIVEGGLDPVHAQYLHSRLDGKKVNSSGKRVPILSGSFAPPAYEIRNRDYGFAIAARYEANADAFLWRISQFLIPFFSMFSSGFEGPDSRNEACLGHAWVPIDDGATWVWSFAAHHGRALTAEETKRYAGRDGTWGPVDAAYMPRLHRGNDYQLDRAAQRTQTYTGIEGTPNQDAAIQESMGPVVDRTRERLGASDMPIIAWRKLMLRLAADLRAGIEPVAAARPAAYNVRSASLILRKADSWVERSARLTEGQAPAV